MAELGRKYQTNVSKHKSCSLFMNRPGQPGPAPRFAYGLPPPGASWQSKFLQALLEQKKAKPDP
jgi:hypothetical protein